MLYPTRFQVRQSTVLVFVVLLMGSVLYEVTRTESGARQHAARTQDIALPADQPTEHKIRPIDRPDYIGRASIASASTRTVSTDEQVGVGTAAATGTTMRTETVSSGGGGVSNGSSAPGRVRSATTSGYAPAGMGGVGAWGGVSGMVRATPPKAAAPAKAPKAAAAKKEPKPAKPGKSNNGNGGSGGAVATATLLPGGFTTGAIEPGAVAGVQGTAAASPAAAPASTPEPMSMFLMGSGLVALYGARRRFQ